MVIGLTGGIGSGKTTVLNYFKKLGVSVYIADIEAKKIMTDSEEVKLKIIDLLGREAYADGGLDRKYIADKVFENKKLLKQLNAIVHPAVHHHFNEFVKKNSEPYLVYENAILFENQSENRCNKVIVVAASLENRIERVIKRDKVEREAVLARMKNQWSQEEKIAKADYVIYNDEFVNLEQKIIEIHKELILLT